jgi:hypothetical protein
MTVGVTPSMVMPVSVDGMSPETSWHGPKVVAVPQVPITSCEVCPVVAATASVGVVVDRDTVGVNHEIHVPAMKFVTDPPPLPEPVKVQVVPEHDPAPPEKLKVNAPDVLLMLVTPPLGEIQAPAASHTCVEEPPVGHVTA